MRNTRDAHLLNGIPELRGLDAHALLDLLPGDVHIDSLPLGPADGRVGFVKHARTSNQKLALIMY